MVLDIIHILFSLNEQGRIHTARQENDSISHNTGLQLDSYLNDFLKYLLPHFPVAPFDTDKVIRIVFLCCYMKKGLSSSNTGEEI